MTSEFSSYLQMASIHLQPEPVILYILVFLFFLLADSFFNRSAECVLMFARGTLNCGRDGDV